MHTPDSKWRLAALVLVAGLVGRLPSQEWPSGDAVPLVRRATAERLRRNADTLLTSWTASAHGVIRFVTLIGDPPARRERLLRADELELSLFGSAPGATHQVITAWRDTVFLPNDIRYHRDHLGIVTGEFGERIRIGDGDEVRDLVHPLSDSGLVYYEFAVGDTTTIATPASQVRVVTVRVRPKVASAAGVVGTLYLDIDRAALVRFHFTFTPAAYRDPTVEAITVTLDNALEAGRRWLPWQQSIEIRRATPWLALPWRTVIRGDWEIRDYRLGVVLPPSALTGPAIDGLRRPGPGGVWDRSLRALIDALPASADDVAAVQRDAARAVGQRLLDGMPRLRLFGAGISDFLHVNRVQGAVVQLGGQFVAGGRTVLQLQGGYGTSDHRVIGHADLAHSLGDLRLGMLAERTVHDLSDHPIASGVENSVETLLSGRDHGDYVGLDRVAMRAGISMAGMTLAGEVARESSTELATRFTPLSGSSRPNPALGIGAATVMRIDARRPGARGNDWEFGLEAGVADTAWDWGRITAARQWEWRAGPGQLSVRARAGLGTRHLPAYRSFALGGRGTLVGVAERSLGGTRMAWLDAGWSLPVALPTPPLPLRGWVALPSTVGVFVALGAAGGAVPGVPWRPVAGVEPVSGVRVDLWGPMLRLESGVAWRTGHVGLTLDIHPDWWPIF